ncbi:hypothetical protein CAEBREN_02154 [Caenorhabditis brenneri]|uniref:Uncharacterized protein n=1 Tax=Caenorhabditis brenneri TaxID=135651 RepID=G0MD99_CAEBE|nr:hypothetical protein CAEBREN_02154 [Caenorhabditis brenneri]
MAFLPAFERRADRIQYVMLENKKRGFRDQKESGKLPHLTVLENWKRQLVARNEEDEDFQEVIQRTAEEFRERDGKALKLANDELVAALKAARAQVGQPDPLAGRNEEERRQFVSLRNFEKKPKSPLGDNSAEVVKNWIEKERRKQREGEGRVTRSGRRIGGGADNVPAVVPEEQVMIEAEQIEIAPAVVDIPIGVPLGLEMLQALDHLLQDVHLVDDEVQEPVESRRFQVAEEVVDEPVYPLTSKEQEQELDEEHARAVIPKAANEPSTSASGELTVEEPNARKRRSQRLVSVNLAVNTLDQGHPMAADAVDPTRRLRESFLALAVTAPKAEPPVDGVSEEQEDVQLDEQEVDQEVEGKEEEEQEAAAEEAPMRSTRRNPKQTERYKEYMASRNQDKQPANVPPVQDVPQPEPSQPSHDENQRPARNKVMPGKFKDFLLH